MARVTRRDTWRRRISTAKLCGELGLQSIDYYIARRQLGWLGHVSRMEFHRLPRRMLSSWVNHRRPRGSPNMTYGRAVKKALKKFGIENDWMMLVADRERWKQALEPENFQAKPLAKSRV